RAEIDHTKCKECGLCAKNCPYNAIVITERPCSSHCPVDAITWNEDGIAYIQEEKCINCGQCLAACPFGAIEDMSYIVPVIEALVGKDQKTACIVAPSIQGQFENTTLKQIFAGLRKLGFDQIYEAALGADIVATEEHEELKEHMEAGIPLTTSCCPAFVTMAKKHFPEVYEKNVSSTVSPMIAMARIVKADQPKTKLVFIGPCMAKKQEALEEFSPVDYVLTFEELAALFIAKNIRCSELEEDTFEDASVFGRNFAMGGGVSKAVVQAADEKGDKAFKAVYADGCFDCKKQLMLLKIGKFNADILEGMSCQGGCINGPGTIENPVKAKVRMTKENADIKKDILPSAKGAEYQGINMHRGK
ncbi:MAG: 4Fe-4S binding protein, partial [Erysipelotrichaceae bacterium]|nr:4Fe-4S binding protein [Erysipelotrichaceae bacterium]